MAGWRLTQAASSDIEDIYLSGFQQFGLAQADAYHEGLTDAFGFLADFPRAAREREELSPPVRIWRYKSHMIIYDLDPGDNVIVLRVRHGREDWLPADWSGSA